MIRTVRVPEMDEHRQRCVRIETDRARLCRREHEAATLADFRRSQNCRAESRQPATVGAAGLRWLGDGADEMSSMRAKSSYLRRWQQRRAP